MSAVQLSSDVVLGRSLIACQDGPFSRYVVLKCCAILPTHSSSDRDHAQQTDVFYLTTPSVAKTK